ncbi:MAG: glycyl-radical enzyme activating protein [Promethearchaeota archaeon]
MEENNACIFEVLRMSTEDGPGIRTTVFFQQCPLTCKWCHNPESISNKPQLQWFKHKCIGCKTCIETCQNEVLSLDKNGLQIDREKCKSCGQCAEECPSTALVITAKWWNLNDLFHEILKDKVYYTNSKGGITVSGGEPTLHPHFLLRFLRMCKENGISTALDTCGIASQKIYEKLIPYIDLFLLDIKEIDSQKHKIWTGVSNEKILDNAVWLSNKLNENNKNIWIRTPIIPKFTATEENIKGIGDFIVQKLNNFPERWDLLAFNNLCSAKYERLGIEWILKDETLLSKKTMDNLCQIAKTTGAKNVRWSGLTKNENTEDSIKKDNKSKLPSC